MLASTTPAPRDRPESAWLASASTLSTVRAGVAGLDLRLDLPALVGRQVADLEERVDEEAEAEFGRQPPGRGVRRVDQAELLEVGHDVADRGRRQRHRQDAADVARADRLAGLEVLSRRCA